MKSLNSQDQLRRSYLAVFFLDLLPRHTNIMASKGRNVFKEYLAKYVHLSPGDAN